MSDATFDPMRELFQAAVVLRAGKGGPKQKAWSDSLDEALYGMSLFLANSAALEAHLAQVVERLTPAEEPVVEAVPLIV